VSTDSPEDGHTFRIRYDSRASSKVTGDPEHTDASDFMGPVKEVQVRAWDLRTALRKAADLPFGELMATEVTDEVDPRLLAIARLVDEATGYAVPYQRSRFMPLDSAFTNALKDALGVPPAHACVAKLEGEQP
jgi:hypothetical protein